MTPSLLHRRNASTPGDVTGRHKELGCGAVQQLLCSVIAQEAQPLTGYQGRSKELRGNAPTLCCTYSFMTAMAYRWGADTAAGNSAMGIGAHLRSDTRHVTSYATMAPRQVPKMAYGLSCACKVADLSGAGQMTVHWSKERKRARQLLCTFKWTQPKCKHNHSTVLRNSKQTERQSSAVATLTLCLAAGPQDCPRVGS